MSTMLIYLKTRQIEMSDEFLAKLHLNKLSNEDSDAMSRPINIREIHAIVHKMKKNKAPGNDGLPIEFYVFFWQDIKGILYYVINEAAHNGFSVNQRRGIISLIEKAGKDPLLIENWRPLSLLNVDYKILSKIIADRLDVMLPQLINHDQSGFMRGRSMTDNLMDLMSAVQLCEVRSLNKILISYDYKQAFDSVEYSVLFKIMKSMNINDDYINMIKALYKQVESCTINCGYTSSYFPITRSLRQGCPLSAPCFLILVETLGQLIRQSER